MMSRYANPRNSVIEKKTVVAQNVAILISESAAVLEETLHKIGLLDVPVQRIGQRAIAIPTSQARRVIDMLHSVDVFPRVVGDVFSEST